MNLRNKDVLLYRNTSSSMDWVSYSGKHNLFITIMILDIIHGPVLKHNVWDTGFRLLSSGGAYAAGPNRLARQKPCVLSK
jgi:hypothetical protein